MYLAGTRAAGRFLPVMGLVFLRHAYSRYLAVKDESAAALPTRGGKKRPATKQDFSRKSAIFLRPEAQFDHLVALPDGDDRARAIIAAMESIEADYDGLRGVLPKGEYQELDNDVLGQLLRTLNPDELKRVSGDVFGRIYEYFLTRFADEKAHDGGEFFTPFSLVSLIAHVLDPDRGTVLDPACGSGGMFVQSARTVEEHGRSPAERLCKLAVRLIETCEKECGAKSSDAWNGRDITRARKAADEARQELTTQDESLSVQAWGQLRKVRYFWRQARWLTERFPDAELRDVQGLIKLVDRTEIEANDWSLTPGRYVGVAPEEEDEDFDFGETMRAIHAELEELDAEAATLAATIRKNFEALGI